MYETNSKSNVVPGSCLLRCLLGQKRLLCICAVWEPHHIQMGSLKYMYCVLSPRFRLEPTNFMLVRLGGGVGNLPELTFSVRGQCSASLGWPTHVGPASHNWSDCLWWPRFGHFNCCVYFKMCAYWPESQCDACQ